MTTAPDSAPERPRLLILTSTFPRWPDDHLPPFVYELAKRLTSVFEIDVLAPHAPGAQRREDFGALRVHRFRYAPARLQRLAYDGGIPVKLKRSPWYALLLPCFLLAQILATRRLLRSRRPAVVHCHWLIPQGFVATLLRRVVTPRPRLLVTAHGADIFALNDPFSRWLKRKTLADADLVTVVSRAMRDRTLALGVHADRLQVAAMGVDQGPITHRTAHHCDQVGIGQGFA